MRGPGGKTVRVVAVLIAVTAVLLVSFGAQAASYDPGAGWRTLKTPHFRIHHPQRIGELAQKAGRILEEIHPTITEKWQWTPWGNTEVVLTDSSDDANGMTTVLPYNLMIIFVTPPRPDTSLANYDDWLRTLLIHEYTHLVQIDAGGGIVRAARIIFGKTASPSGMNPVWMREGIAQYDETVLTDGGRGRGSYSEMVVRTSMLEDAFPSIDEADGLGWKWPSGSGAYIYGIKFVQWLMETYGEERFHELDKRIRSSALLGMLNHHARNVYGKTFYELWNEWRRALTQQYAELQASVAARGETQPAEIVVPTGRDGQYAAPALSPDGTRLVYSMSSPHGKPEIRMLDLTTGETDVLKKGSSALQFSWSPDGQKIAWSTGGKYKNYNFYYDLWLYDFTVEKVKKRVKRLTTGERARDPEFDRSGNAVIFVAGDEGTDRLKRIDVESREITELTPQVVPFTQFANPRLSPDGRFIAVSVWRQEQGWRVYRYSVDGTAPLRLSPDSGLAVESRPVWTPDGRHVVFSSDQTGIANLYRVRADGGAAMPLTNVISGVFQPQIATDGRLFAQYYTAKGFVIARFDGLALMGGEVPAPAGKAGKSGKAGKGGEGDSSRNTNHELRVTGTERAGATGTVLDQICDFGDEEETWPDPKKPRTCGDFTERPYVAFGKSLFLPRFILPYAMYGDGYFFLSALTGGSDPLRWHSWAAAGTYRTDANFWGFTGLYAYNRFKPIFGAVATRFVVDYGNIAFLAPSGAVDIVRYFEKRQRFAGFMGVPLGSHGFSVSYFFEDHTPWATLTQPQKNALNLGHFAGFTGEYKYGDAETYPAAVSKENGRTIKLTGSVTNKYLGSGDDNEQIIAAGDWREYVRLYHHHVLALRAAGGMTWGDQLVQGTFGLGGAIGEGTLASGGSFNYYPLRGLPVSAISATRAMLLSGEYRFPIISPQRGIGTVPLFLKHLSGAIFADFGDGWNASTPGKDNIKDFFDTFFLGVGTELRGDFIIGHGLPLHGRLGYAIIVLNRDRLGQLTDPILGTSVSNGMLILTFGTSF